MYNKAVEWMEVMKRSFYDWGLLVFNLIFLSILYALTIIVTLGLGFGTGAVAMYRVCFKMLALTDTSLMRDYLSALRESFRKTWLLNIVIAAAAYFLWFYITNRSTDALLAFNVSTPLFLMLVIAFILASAFMYLLPLLAYFDASLKHTVFSAFALSINYFLLTLLLYLVIAAALFSTQITNGFSVLLLPAGYVYVSAAILRPVFEKHKEGENEKNV